MPKKNGRPTDYEKEYDEKAFKLCLLGATDKQIADFFDVSEQTINTWKKKHKSFLESLKRGKTEADSVIAESLYHRAKGYSHPEEKIVTLSAGDGAGSYIERVDTIKHYPPDPTSCIFWLKNRQKENWRESQEIDQKSSDGSMSPKEFKVTIVK